MGEQSAFEHIMSLHAVADTVTPRQSYAAPTLTRLSGDDPRVVRMVADHTIAPEGVSGIPATGRMVRKTTVGIPAAPPIVTHRGAGVITATEPEKP